MIKATGIKKTYINGVVETPVLKGIDIEIADGEFVSIMGRSGAGKSTLMYQLSLLDTPTAGDIFLEGKEVHKLNGKQRLEYRLNNLGYIFQDYALVPELTAVENVMMPLLMQGMTQDKAYKKSAKVLTSLGLKKQINNLPSQMSGGEQQRASIGRAIVHGPKILFADEPTANLDAESARVVIDILKELHAKGQTIVMVTHEEEYGKETNRIIRLSDGKIIENEILNN